MARSKVLAFFFFSLFFVSCNKSFDDKEGLLEYVSDESNGYRFSKSINGIDYVLQYKPTDMMVMQENEKPTAEEARALREKYVKNIYFNLSMSKEGNELLNKVEDRDKYLRLVDDLTFKMDHKIALLGGKDTLHLLHYNYPRVYGMARATTLLLVYPRDEEFLKKDGLQLIIQDIGFYTGEVRFKIDNNTIINEPFINFNKSR